AETVSSQQGEGGSSSSSQVTSSTMRSSGNWVLDFTLDFSWLLAPVFGDDEQGSDAEKGLSGHNYSLRYHYDFRTAAAVVSILFLLSDLSYLHYVVRKKWEGSRHNV
ncbi:unnamed protein product, partial [Amoebophrya sp. A25]